MLNNLSNFFNIIVGRRIKTQLENSDLIAVGTKQSPALGDYKPTAITFADLAAQLGGGSVNYSNVVFVDVINGNDSTGLINRFDKPFATISNALVAASALPGLSTNNRALIYIRRGAYVNPIVNLTDSIDFYCEAGVVFTGSVRIRDNGNPVISNIYGHLRINQASSVIPVVITGGSIFTFEFDQIVSTPAAMELNTTQTGSRITIKGNYIYSGTLGQGFGITIRNAANVTLDIANAIEAVHSVIAFRFYTGTTVINCPNINLLSSNIYGGNFKQAIIVYDVSSVGKITVNGNLSNLDTVNYGGTGSLVTLTVNAQPRLTINGNLYGGVTKALDGNTATNGIIEINGNMSSSNLYTAWAYGSGQVVIKNSVIINTATSGTNYVIAINNTAKVFFKDCFISNTLADQSVIQINGAATNLVLDGCQIWSAGTLGNSLISTAGAITTRINNTRSNKALGGTVTDLYSPSGFILDTNVITPIQIN